MAKKSHRKRLATVRSALIDAIIGGHYKLKTSQDAFDKLAQLRREFVCAREQQDDFSLTLWIRGYAVSEEESAQGYYGHYAIIRPEQIGDGAYTLRVEKYTLPLQNHPDKRRPKRSHPDWGHPTLRAVKNNTLYNKVEQAQKALDSLQSDYPNIAIPGNRKLSIMIYEKQEKGGGNPVKKYILRIVPHEGKHRIDAEHNQPMVFTAEKEQESQGHFTALVNRRKKKK